MRLAALAAAFRRAPLPWAECSLGLLFLLCACSAIWLTRTTGGIALIWPANAAAAAVLIRFRTLRRAPALAAIAVAAVLANVVGANDPLHVAVAFAAVNVAEVALMTWVYRSLVQFPIPRINVNQATHLTVVFGITIPALAAVAGAALVHLTSGRPLWSTMFHWWTSDALGACLFGPAIILYESGAARRLSAARFAMRNLLLLLICLAFCVIAIRYIRFPFVVMSLPLLTAAFSIGGFGTAVLSLSCGVAIVVLWAHGIRPSGLDPFTHASALSELPMWALISTLMPAVAVGIGSDERRQVVRMLRSSEQRFRESLSRSPIGAVIVDLNGVWIETNAAVQAMLGYSAQEFRNFGHGELTHPDDHDDIRRRWEDLRKGTCEAYDVERRFRHKSGTWILTRAAVSLVRDHEGRPLHYIAQMESLESRRATERALAQERELLKTTLRAIGNGVITTDAQCRISYLNAAARDMLGQSLTDLTSRRFDEVVVLTDPASSQPAPDLVAQSLALGRVMRRATACVLHRSDGGVTYVNVSVSPLFDKEDCVAGTVIVLLDVTEQYERERDMTHQARHDALTGLANRFQFQRRAKRALQRARLLGESAAIIAIDLDRFKAVNDVAGHAAGDAVLIRVATVLQSLLRRSDTVARLGGDEFAVILENCAAERASVLAMQVLEALNPLQTPWLGATHTTGASVGVAVVTPDVQDEAAWLSAADAACYAAKRAGRGTLRTAGELMTEGGSTL